MTGQHKREETGEQVVVECELDAPPETVWRALTVPELVAEWVDPGSVDRGSETAPDYEMIDALPFSRVRYAWHDAASSEPDTLVTFEIAPQPDGRTWFRLTHRVAAAARAPRAAANCNTPLARAA